MSEHIDETLALDLAEIIESGSVQAFDVWQQTVFNDHLALINAGVPGAREKAYKSLIDFLVQRQLV